MNFTLILDSPMKREWGSKLPNGSWNGLVMHLMQDDIDLGKKDYV